MVTGKTKILNDLMKTLKYFRDGVVGLVTVHSILSGDESRDRAQRIVK
jgi:hypothetical protein